VTPQPAEMFCLQLIVQSDSLKSAVVCQIDEEMQENDTETSLWTCCHDIKLNGIDCYEGGV